MTKEEKTLLIKIIEALVIGIIKRIENEVDSIERQFYHKEGDKLVASEPRELGALDATALISNFLNYCKHRPDKLFEDENIKGEGN